MQFFNWPKSLKKVKEKHEKELFNKEGVFAVAEGTKITNGVDTGRKCISVFVKGKLPETALLEENKIPKKIEGFETDIIDLGGEIEPLHKTKHRPVRGGISGIVEGGSACSIGIVCFKDGKPYILTNDHCVSYPYCGTNNVGKKFLQPSPFDGGKTTDAIGTINTAPTIRNDIINKIDSAIVPLDADYELKVQGLEDYPKKWAKPAVGMGFIKVGRTTGITKGTITHINATAKVNYGGNLGVCKFYPCILATQNNHSIVDGGDSGSCIFNNDGVIGQTFAASPNLAIFLTGEVIGKELGIELSNEYFVAAGREWYIELPLGKTKTRVNLNLRTSPRVSPDTLIKTLPKGTEIEVKKHIGNIGGYEWLQITI